MILNKEERKRDVYILINIHIYIYIEREREREGTRKMQSDDIKIDVKNWEEGEGKEFDKKWVSLVGRGRNGIKKLKIILHAIVRGEQE